ncbi:beta-lactamase family protein [Shewanella sp. LC6]|jgi:CubicO group peptidase (beta-lactamase class C family)|uniref:serine hydrolase domain-containing protein n=1 Tax=Shewanella TaxID=22 RepID=UPI000027C2B8|nr:MULTISPECIES: serine hydrolase domain-containing protein [Shewanella]ASF15609.1 serine hydrolase [Shewanella sp. FDAARGOS_354]MDH1624692.1 beta-lactamase family protein [Shewanella xiamenensis]PWH04509.1 serine hydrolase [Shewanella xiamenensis]QQK61354.1 beta-lactamase family protein [Shewanella sp. LC6]TPE57380.1 serine hydrolase [Shewanella sp. LC2]
MRLSVIGSLLSGLLLFPSANSVGESLEAAIVSESAQGGQSVKLESQTASSASKSAEIKSLIQAAIKDSPQPLSGSVILLERGKPLFELQKGEGISKDSRFVMASLSKQITATLILQAVDAGKLDLTQTLNHYLLGDAKGDNKALKAVVAGTNSSANALNPGRYDERITLHQLLTHTSGVDKLGKANRFEPGSQFEYSNFGYSLLGQVLEKVNHQSFAEQVTQFAARYQLNGLSAEQGSLEAIHAKVPSLAVGLQESEVIAPAELVIDEALLPAGGLIASAATYADFQQQLHAGKLLSPESYQRMTTAYTEIQFLWPNMRYGYGIRINKDDGLVEYSHTGYLTGYMSMTLHYPEFNLDLVMLENLSLNLNDRARVFELHNQIRQIIRSQLLLAKAANV